MIGACTKMQTITLEEEIELMDGVPYYFDFYQDFSHLILNGTQIQDISTLNLFELIYEEEGANISIKADNYNSQALDYRRSKEIWKAAEKYVKEERAWKKHNKKIGAKESYKNWKCALKDLGVEIE